MTEFSFVVKESISANDFLPILAKITDALNLIHDRFTQETRVSDQIQLTIGQDSVNANVYGSIKTTNEMAVNTDDRLTSFPFAVAEESKHEEDLKELERMLPKEYSESGLVIGMKRFIKDLRTEENSDLDESSIDEKPTTTPYQALRSEFDKLKSTKLELEKQLESYAKVANENESLKNINERLQNDVDMKNDEIKSLHNKSLNDLNSLRHMYENKEKEFGSVITEKQHFKTLIDQLQKEKEDMGEKLEALEKKYTNVSDSLKKKKDEVKEKDSHISELDNTIEEMASEIRNVRRENNRMKNESKRLKEEIEECENVKADSCNVMKSLKKELKECRKQLEDDVGKEVYKDEINDLNNKIKSLEIEKNKITKEKVKFQTTVEDIQTKLEEATKRCENHDTHCKQLETMYEGKLKEKNETINTLNADIEAKKEAMANMREAIHKSSDVSSTEIKQLNLQLNAKDKAIEDLDLINKNLNEKVKTLNAEIEAKKSAMVNMREKISKGLEASPSDIKRLTLQLNAKDMEMESMHLKIENLNETLEQYYKDIELERTQKQQLKVEIENMKKLSFSSFKPSETESPPQPKPPVKGQIPDWWKPHMTATNSSRNLANVPTETCPNCHRLIPVSEIKEHFDRCISE